MAFALRRHGGATPRRDDRVREDVAPRPSRTRVAAARGAWAVGTVFLTIARIVRLIVAIAVLIIVAAIVLRLASANTGNAIVRDINDVGKVLVAPFKNIFSLKNAKTSMAVNWGIGALVWLIVGGFIARLIARAAPRGVHPREPVV